MIGIIEKYEKSRNDTHSYSLGTKDKEAILIYICNLIEKFSEITTSLRDNIPEISQEVVRTDTNMSTSLNMEEMLVKINGHLAEQMIERIKKYEELVQDNNKELNFLSKEIKRLNDTIDRIEDSRELSIDIPESWTFEE